MSIVMKIHNVKNITDFEFSIPTEKGLYALTGENGSGKSTVISCAATSFYVPSLYAYFGEPKEGSAIDFYLEEKHRIIRAENKKWHKPKGYLDITGYYEGSIVFGTRFKDVDYSMLDKLANIERSQLVDASDFVKKNLGIILHDDELFYEKLYALKKETCREMGLQRNQYYYDNQGTLISQLNMSTGENLLLTILKSLEIRLGKRNRGGLPSFIFLDEIELALHSSALRRLVFFLRKIADEHNFVVLFSTHSIELIRSIRPENIFYLQRHIDNSIEVINPCYPIYATRNLESSNYGHDYIIMVEDDLAKKIVEKILYQKNLLSNKRVLVIAVGGWTQVLRFAYDTIRSNLTMSTTKIMIILDRDIKESVPGFMKNEKIGFSTPPNYLPIKSLEKYLLEKLVNNVDHVLFRKLNDYLFQGKSLDDIIRTYNHNVKNGIYTDVEKISNGKMLYELLRHELQQIRKMEDDLVQIITEHLFENSSPEIEELTQFLESTLKM
ncbi:MAG: AAA family ATPase [Lachnospiraceae bacterium]|nr:AAA family ATPase [Lachnospiraceae bacterium]